MGMAENKDKIILYLDKTDKKIFLVYDEKEFLDGKKPLEFIDNGTNKYIDQFKEKWELQTVKRSKNRLSIEFKLIQRKI
jgi:hypothetical protein